jgi:uncharacterized protein with HEPN domain
MSRSTRPYLQHILNETRYLTDRTRGLSKETFLRDETLQRAFVRSLEIIGEAAKQLPDDFRQQHSQLEWRAMAGMRDRLIHAYFGVDYDIVWDAVTRKIPLLQQEIERILHEDVPDREA